MYILMCRSNSLSWQRIIKKTERTYVRSVFLFCEPMSYLLDLVKSFDENELTQFKKLDVIGKEALIRDAYANNSLVKTFDETALPAKYGLTKSHFDKINSVLLTKIIKHLYGDDYAPIFANVHNKGLINLLFHQIKFFEKKITKTEAAVFYKSVFDVYINLLVVNYDEQQHRAYGKKYLAALGSPTFEDNAEIELRLLLKAIHTAMARAQFDVFSADAKQQLDQWAKKVEQQQSAVAKFWYGYALSEYYKYASDNPQDLLSAALLTLEAFRAAGDKLNKANEAIPLVNLGLAYLAAGDPHKALQTFDKVMENFPETTGKHRYAQSLWMHAAIISRDYKKACMIYNKTWRLLIADHHYPTNVADALVFGLTLAFYENDNASADTYFQKLKLIEKKKLSNIIASLIRVYETAYHYFAGNRKTALQVAHKHLVYSRRKKLDGNYLWHYQFIECVFLLIKYQNGNKRLFNRLNKAANELKTGVYSMYNNLLRDEWERVKQNHT